MCRRRREDTLAIVPKVGIMIDVDATPERVASVFVDPELMPAWATGLAHFEVVSGEPGTAGCVGRAHYVERGREYVVDDILERVTPTAAMSPASEEGASRRGSRRLWSRSVRPLPA